MTAAAALLPPAPDAADDRPALLDRQLAMLAELAEIGMAVARSVGRQAGEGPDGQGRAVARGVDLTLAFSRISRAVRLTLMLQSRLSGAQAGDGAAFASSAASGAARRARARRLVERFVREDHPQDEDAVERLMAEAVERLDEEEDFDDMPMSQIVGLICNDLRLSSGRVLQALELSEEADAGPAAAEPRGRGRDPSPWQVMWIGDPPRPLKGRTSVRQGHAHERPPPLAGDREAVERAFSDDAV